MSNNYWLKRQEREKEALANKTQEEINIQLNKYYSDCIKKVIDAFEATYDKLLAAMDDGKEVTVADLYKLDRYWQMQAQLAQLCKELGNKEIELLSKEFVNEWQDVYKSVALTSDEAFTRVDTRMAEQMIKTNWVGDGKDFSQRVWNNTKELAATLNDQLVYCVTTGAKTKDLRNLLMERFSVSRSKANTLIRTETRRISTQATAQRYEDDGLTQYRIKGREEADGCSKACHEMDGKIFYFKDMQIGKNAPPFHPNCRCIITPILDDEFLRKQQDANREKARQKRAKEAEAKRLREEANELRIRARELKKEGKTDEAKQLEARARDLEKQYKEIYTSLK